MKYLKMLGLAAIAAMGLMAFVGASSASATTLSSEGKNLPAGTTILASLTGSAELKETGGQVLDTCTAGTVHLVTANETGSSINTSGEVGITWGETGTACTHTTDTIKGGTGSITYTSGLNGTVVSSSAEVTVETAGLSCIYGTASTGTTLGVLQGSTTANATLEINVPVLKKGGAFLCPGSAVWKAKYVVTKVVYNGTTYSGAIQVTN